MEEKISALHAELERLIKGKHHPGFRCRCGHLEHAELVAVVVLPYGTHPRYWTVALRESGTDTAYEGTWPRFASLRDFLPLEQIQELFSKHLGLPTAG